MFVFDVLLELFVVVELTVVTPVVFTLLCPAELFVLLELVFPFPFVELL